jgi:hypothetical protein
MVIKVKQVVRGRCWADPRLDAARAVVKGYVETGGLPGGGSWVRL